MRKRFSHGLRRLPREFVAGGMVSRYALNLSPNSLDLPERIWAIGGTNYVVGANGLIVGGEGAGGGQRRLHPNPADDRDLVYGGGGGNGLLGIPLIHRGPMRIYPLVGFGGGGGGAAYLPHWSPRRAPGARPPKPEPIAGSGGAYLRIGVGIELRIGGRAGVFIGVRFGYAFRPIWVGGGRSATGGPFSQFIVGVFYRR